MANKVFNLDNGRVIDSIESLEVFIDLDKTAIDNYNYKYKDKPQLKDFIAYLKYENNEINADSISVSIIESQNVVTQQTLSAIALTTRLGYDNLLEEYYKFTNAYRYRLGKLVNVDAVKNSIHNIFTWIKGERIINPEFGNDLRRYLYEGITDSNIEQIIAEIKGCISKWEPRVIVVDVKNIGTIDDTENNTVHLEVVYRIPDLSDEQYYYSFYYNKGD